MSTYSVINDFNEVKKLIDILPDLKPTEVFFISLSARKKYLTDVERTQLQLSRAEMFARTIIREKTYEKFYKLMRRMETNVEGYQTKRGKSYPTKAVVTYININPSDMLLANSEYQKKIAQYTYELTRALLNKKKCDSIMKKFSKLDVEFMNCVQRSRGNKKFIDIDFDINKETEYSALTIYLKFLRDNEIKYYVIETKSGYHVLMDRATINCNFHIELQKLDKLVEKEIVLNKNEMIPCPGTLQGGFAVRFLNL